MEAMIRLMADAPEDERQQMMTDRLKMFATMPEEQCVESSSQLIIGFSKLAPEQREELIGGRTAIIANLSENERKTVLIGYLKAGGKVGPEIHGSDMELANKAAMRLPPDQQDAFMASMDAAKAEVGGTMERSAFPAAPGIPQHHGKPMELKGVFGKKYVCSVCGHKQAA